MRVGWKDLWAEAHWDVGRWYRHPAAGYSRGRVAVIDGLNLVRRLMLRGRLAWMLLAVPRRFHLDESDNPRLPAWENDSWHARWRAMVGLLLPMGTHEYGETVFTFDGYSDGYSWGAWYLSVNWKGVPRVQVYHDGESTW